MRIWQPPHACTLFLLASLALPSPARAAITGQWDFKGSNLVATNGLDLGDLNPGGLTPFGSTTSFGIASVGGQPTNVMRFPRAVGFFGGYSMACNASPNGGGGYVNQYSV